MIGSVNEARRKIAQICSAMLEGSTSYIVGARQIVRLRFDARLEHDPDILPFVGADSETDALPLSEDIKRLWSPNALEKLQPEIDRAEQWARNFLEPRCQALVTRFGSESSN
jgi:hypothetical protein